MRCIFAADLAQHDAMLSELLDISAFLGVRDGNAAIAHLHMRNAIILAYGDIVFKLIADQERFKKGAPKIDRQVIGLIDLDLLPEMRGHERSAKTQFDNIYMG